LATAQDCVVRATPRPRETAHRSFWPPACQMILRRGKNDVAEEKKLSIGQITLDPAERASPAISRARMPANVAVLLPAGVWYVRLPGGRPYGHVAVRHFVTALITIVVLAA